MLSRDAILKANDSKVEKVDVPEWGGHVCVRVMSGRERDAFERKVLGTEMENIRAKLVAATACDDSGARLFSDNDIPELGEKSAAALDRVYTVALRLNRIGARDVEELKKA